MDKRSPLHRFQRTGQGVVEKDDLKKRIYRAARGRLCSGHSQRVRVDLFFRFSFDLCVFRPTRAGCTLDNSKAGPAPTLLPCGQWEPTKASDLDIHNDHETDIDSDIEYENDNDNDENDKNHDDDNNDDNDDDKTGDNGNDDNDNDDHENVKNPENFKMWKTKTIQFSLCGCFSLKKTQARIWRQVSEDGETQSDFMEKLHVEQFFGRHVWLVRLKRKARSRACRCACTARCSLWKTSCGGLLPNMKKETSAYECVVVRCMWNAI